MTQGMDGDGVGESGLLEIMTQDVSQFLCPEGRAQFGDEDAGVKGSGVQVPGPYFAEVFFEIGGGDFAEGDKPVFLAFALVDAQYAFFKIEVGEFQSAEFAAAESGGKQDFKDGSIPIAAGGAEVGLLQKGHDLLAAQDVAGPIGRAVEDG